MRTTVLIAGLGLIGGSLAESIQRVHPDVEILGFDTNPDSCEEAIGRGVIDRAVPSLKEGAKEAMWIVLAAPVSAIQSMIEELSRVDLRPDTVVTDVGSSKRNIMQQAARCLRGRCCFVGGHPMAGSHRSGVSASRADLFENAYYFLVADPNEDQTAIHGLQTLLKGTRAKFIRVTPEVHDQIVGVISHFPHLVASALVHHLVEHPIEGMNLRMLAAGGFRDITRIASSDPDMWTDIVMSNRDILLHLLDGWVKDMDRLKKMLIDGDPAITHAFFRRAKLYRDGFPKKEKGAIPGYYDLYVDVPDKPDTISRVTGYIGREGINLANIEIIEARENVLGVMRLTFQDAKAREAARHILSEKGYHTYLNE
ncbi:prephenate dehydrogenase [Sporolactobacillus sp. THM7-7]|nr:prephenate dehydrogenase [Sporolactobacillus sp. THM7-7]